MVSFRRPPKEFIGQLKNKLKQSLLLILRPQTVLAKPAVTSPPAFMGLTIAPKSGRFAVTVTIRSAPRGTVACSFGSIMPFPPRSSSGLEKRVGSGNSGAENLTEW